MTFRKTIPDRMRYLCQVISSATSLLILNIVAKYMLHFWTFRKV